MHSSNFDFIEKPVGEVSPRKVGRANIVEHKISKVFNELAKKQKK